MLSRHVGQILGSGQNLMGDYSQQEKGILKKPGPGGYCPAMDKDRSVLPSLGCPGSQSCCTLCTGGTTGCPPPHRTI